MARPAKGSGQQDLRQRIAQRAYALWEQQGRVHGQDRAHWLQAEAELGAAAKSITPRRRTSTTARSQRVRKSR